MAFWSGAADRSLAQWTDVRYAAISTNSAGAITVSVANIGGGANHNNMSPFLVINYVIRAVAAAPSDLSALRSELQSLRSELNELKKLLL
jgi:microcystin-dependent protein